MRQRCALIVAVTVFLGGCSVQSPESSEISLVREVEESLVLPDSSEPLRKYDRTYAIGPVHIKGVLLFNGAEEGKVSIVNDSHLHMERKDGGCGAIQVVYDRAQNRWTKIICNGSA